MGQTLSKGVATTVRAVFAAALAIAIHQVVSNMIDAATDKPITKEGDK